MELFAFGIPALYFLFLLVLSTFLLIRGVTHTFVALFACGAFLHVLQMLGFFYMRQAPGGFSANSRFLPVVSAIGTLGTLVLGAAFLLLTLFLLKTRTPHA